MRIYIGQKIIFKCKEKGDDGTNLNGKKDLVFEIRTIVNSLKVAKETRSMGE